MPQGTSRCQEGSPRTPCHPQTPETTEWKREYIEGNKNLPKLMRSKTKWHRLVKAW